MNELGQRTSVKQSGSAFDSAAFNLYGYDNLGQLTSAQRYLGTTLTGTDSPVSGQQYGFAFDNIGNRLTATLDTTGTTAYTPNALNQYSAIQSGTAAAVSPTYDEDGNTLTNGTLTNTWDGENRLVSITKTDGSIINCVYDAQSRRVRKTVTSGSTVTSDTGFIYDNWNMVGEYSLAATNGTTTATLAATNTWGTDLSGSPQGAGGVGGLLARTSNSATYAYTYDGNGNVSELVDGSGSVVAHYEYGPFGEPVRATGIMAAQNPFRFSTKYTDDDAGGLVLYEYRPYQPLTGRWLSRDPIGENGGANLYAMCFNTPIGAYDYLGREPRPVNGGASTANGFNSSQNSLFKDVADKGAGGKGKGKETPTGEELLDYFKELSKDNCCIKKLTIAGHGWAGPVDGPGLPGNGEGNGLYQTGSPWATSPQSRTLDDLQKDISSGKTRFCKPCQIQIHACNVSADFAQSLGSATGCTVTFAQGSCSPRNNNKKWHSGVGHEDGYDNKENGFWQTNGGAPATPIGNTYTPR